MVMEATPSAQSVGREFVRQYYTLLNRAPTHLHRFYNNNSSFIHGGLSTSDREVIPAIGQKEIHRKIQELDFRDCHAKISQVDSQATLDKGVVVQVTGELSNAGEPMRRFTQTFVLAAQAPKMYYVHNDIFRYQDLGFPDEEEGETSLGETGEREVEEGRSENEEDDSHQHSTGQNVLEQQGHPTLISGQPTLQQPQPTIYYSAPPQQQVHPGMQPVINGSVHEETPLINQQTAPLTQQPDQTQAPPSNQQNSYINDASSQEQFSEDAESSPEKSQPNTTDEEVRVETEESQEPQETENFQTNTTEPESEHSITNMDSSKPKSYARTVRSMAIGSNSQAPKSSTSPLTMQTPRIDDRPVVRSMSNARTSSRMHRSSNQTSQQHQTQQQPHDQTQSQQNIEPQRPSRVGPIQKDNRRRDWPDHHQLFVGNVPHQASETELRLIFENFGKVVDLHIHCKTNDRSKGPPGQNNSTRVPNYGFVTFEDPSIVAKVLEALPIGYPDDKGLKLNIEEKKNRPRGLGEGNMRSNANDGNMRSSMGGQQQQQQQRGQGGSGGPMRGLQHGARVGRGGFSRGGDGPRGGGMRQPSNLGGAPNYQNRR